MKIIELSYKIHNDFELIPEHIDAKTLPNYIRSIDSSLSTIKDAYSELLSIDDLLKELDGVKKGE